MLEEIQIFVPRMNCGGCLNKVTNALQELPGVVVEASDIAAKTLDVRYEPEQTSLEQMRSVLAAARYPIEREVPLAQDHENQDNADSATTAHSC